MTREFYIVVLHKKAKTKVFSEIMEWAIMDHYDGPLSGVELRICTLSKFNPDEPWNLERSIPLD